MLSEIECYTCFVYSPRDPSELGLKARSACHQLKRGDEKIISSTCRYVATNRETLQLADILGPHVTLVPVPGSKPLHSSDSLWPARSLVESLVRHGMGRDWHPLLLRTTGVPKSAFAPPGSRPTARRHYDTMHAVPANLASTAITLVDDVITKGATMLGALSRLTEAWPDIPVAGFALVRTMSYQAVRKNPLPALCRIRLDGERTVRNP